MGHPYVSYGGGVNSTAMTLLILTDPRFEDLRDDLRIVFADTGAELPSTDFKGLMAFIKDIWEYTLPPSPYWTQDGNLYSISTGGWSGNEDIIGAMEKNWLFWSLCWESSRRGGHYEFEIREVES